MKRVAIYMRVSTDRQAQEGDSIPAQRNALTKYINEHDDLVLSGEYLDDGISGTKSDRDELQRLLADVIGGKIDLILVTKLDRLYRSIRHYLNLQDTLDRYGVNWLAIWEPIYDTSTPQGRLIINQMMSIAQFEAEQTGQRIRQVMEYKVTQGHVISGQKPLGYTIQDKRLVPDGNADLIRQVFEYYSFCGNLRETTKHFSGSGTPKTSTAMKHLLQNKKYIGQYRGNDNFCEPLISKRLFRDVQRKLSINVKTSQKRVYLFSGLIRCGGCGCLMEAHTRNRFKGKEVSWQYYRCPTHYHTQYDCPNAKQVSERKLEKYLLDNVREQLSGIVLSAEIEVKPIKENRSKIAIQEKRLSKLKELYINDLISLEEYKKDKAQAQEEIARLNAETPPEPPDVSAIQDLLSKPFEAIYGTFSREEKRYFWRTIIKEIGFDMQRALRIIFYPDPGGK